MNFCIVCHTPCILLEQNLPDLSRDTWEFSPTNQVSGPSPRVIFCLSVKECLETLFCSPKIILISYNLGDFPGSPVVENLPSNAVGAGLISDRTANIPHASRPRDQNIKQKKQCCKNSIKTLKMVHKKKKKKSYNLGTQGKHGMFSNILPSFS